MTPTGIEDERLAALAWAYAERADPLPEGRSGTVTAACRAATIFRIIHGKSIDSEVGPVLPSLLEDLS